MARTSNARRIDPKTTDGKGVSADQFNLKAEERAMLPDPNWVTQDDADAIICKRRERKAGKNVSLKDILRENGIQLDR